MLMTELSFCDSSGFLPKETVVRLLVVKLFPMLTGSEVFESSSLFGKD